MAIATELFSKASDVVTRWRRPLVVTHARPDGDAIGCLTALRSIFRSLGSNPLAVLFDPVPHAYQFLVAHDPVGILGRDIALEALAEADGVMVVDTCAFEQLRPLADWLRGSWRPVVVADHHVTRDVPADVHLIDTSASAAALVVYEWARAVNWPLDDAAARALFIGTATDTGWFRFSNTDARTLERCAELLRRGIAPSELYDRIFNSERPGKIKLLGAALGSLELLEGERIAVMQLTLADLARSGADSGDTEGAINEPMRIASVEASVLLVEQREGGVRVSLRSRARLDVASIAASLGGGGHARAAGARMSGTLAEVHQRVLVAIRAEL